MSIPASPVRTWEWPPLISALPKAAGSVRPALAILTIEKAAESPSFIHSDGAPMSEP
jgi:hypothetical protein